MHPTLPIRLCVLALALSAFAATGAFAAKTSAVPTDVGIQIEMTAPDHATIHSVQTWNGSAAHDMRQSLDAYFGTGSGDLSADEVMQIENASEADLANHTLPFVRFGGQEPMVLSAQVRLVDAAGAVSSTGPMSVDHLIEVAVPPTADGNGTLEVDSRWNGTMSFSPPPGYVVTSSPQGAAYRFDGPISSEGSLSLSYGPEEATPATAEPTPEGNATPTSEPQESAAPTRESAEPTGPTREVPTSGSMLVAITLGIAALWLARHQTYRR